jgi:hypothetical protein
MLQKIRSKQQRNLDYAEKEIESFKMTLGMSILKLTFGDLKKMNSYDEVESELKQTMKDINLTLKETAHKNDDGMLHTYYYLCW